jgi:hypothetical protein
MKIPLSGSVCETTTLSAAPWIAAQRLYGTGVAVVQRIKREMELMPLSKRTG